MATFEATVSYGDVEVTVSAGDFAELHRVIAGVLAMEQRAEELREQGAKEVVPGYQRKDGKDEYYFVDRRTGRRISLGPQQEEDDFPFTPPARVQDQSEQRPTPASSSPQPPSAARDEEQEAAPAEPAPPASEPPRASTGSPISKERQLKVWNTAKRTGYDKPTFKKLLAEYGAEGFSDITADIYDDLLSDAESEEKRLALMDDLPF